MRGGGERYRNREINRVKKCCTIGWWGKDESKTKNKLQILNQNKKNREANKGRINKQRKEYRCTNKEQVAKSNKEWRKANRAYISDYLRTRYNADPAYRASQNLRNRVRLAIKNEQKTGKTLELLGCSMDSLMRHLAAQFKPGMSWENYGEWHIDHIRPCASFDLADALQQRECFHYTNLQPLWAEENISKGARII